MAKIRGLEIHLARVQGLTGTPARREITAALFEAGDIVATEAAILISTGGGFGKSHVVSAPGEPPNEDTGFLNREDNLYRRIVGGDDSLHVQVIADAPYAAALEFGTSRMAERPFMRPALARTRKEVVNTVRARVNDIIAGKRLRD